jgi:hypothetical protein
MAHAHFMLVTKVADTHSEYVISFVTIFNVLTAVFMKTEEL